MVDFYKNINKINQSINPDNLPGKKVQYQMAPPGRIHDYPQNSSYHDAAVALLLYPKDNNIYFPLIQRTLNNHNDKHSGQISLPGGKYEQSDKSLLDCAIRELEEELGVKKNYVNPLGNLTDLYIPVSNFRVQPYIVYSKNSFKFVPQPSEVQYVLEIKLEDLLEDKNLKKGKITLDSGAEFENIPYFYLNNHIIWGATAMILNEFKNVVTSIKTK